MFERRVLRRPIDLKVNRVWTCPPCDKTADVMLREMRLRDMPKVIFPMML